MTVADDLALLARKHNDMQVMLWDVENNTSRERYCVNPTKSCCLCYSPIRNMQTADLYIAGDKILCQECTVHLGISRNVKYKANIEEKISTGRKTAYSLMRAGFNSVNGLKTCLNGHIWSTFVVPRLVYGLEVLTLQRKDIENLEMFQRKSLRQIQGLPDKTSNSITLALLGILPLETVIHKNALNLFMNIARSKDCIEYEIAERQLVMKGDQEKRWFNFIKSVLDAYNLPSMFYLFDKQMSKTKWKHTLTNLVNSHIEASWRSEISSKLALKYVNPLLLKVGKAHPIWATVRNGIADNRRAQLKCKLLTGSYILQGNMAAFNQYTVDATCKLRLAVPETRQHFIAECSAFTPEREVYSEKLQNSSVLRAAESVDLTDPEVFTQLTLDGSVFVTSDEDIAQLELFSRDFIDQIHRKRVARLKQISQC